MTDTPQTIPQDPTTVETDETGAEGTPPESGKLVPVTESIRYRRRAQQAERKLEELQAQCGRLNTALTETREALDAAERRRQIDELLVEAEAIDLEAARLLTMAALEQMDQGELAEVVDDLRRHKPYLFRRHDASGGGMSPRPRPAPSGADAAAEAAAATGDRRDLLRYLRLRRSHE